jgi:hypothetical protein
MVARMANWSLLPVLLRVTSGAEIDTTILYIVIVERA